LRLGGKIKLRDFLVNLVWPQKEVCGREAAAASVERR
jgi:hypothetical protein